MLWEHESSVAGAVNYFLRFSKSIAVLIGFLLWLALVKGDLAYHYPSDDFASYASIPLQRC